MTLMVELILGYLAEVKISRRKADKVVVVAYFTVTDLDNWMSQCIGCIARS